MMVRFAISGLLAVLLVPAFACNTSDSNRMPGVEHPPRPANYPIDVIVHPFAPDLLIDAIGKKFVGTGPEDAEVIGDFDCGQVDYTSSRQAPLKRAIAAAQVEARNMGGDAILIRDGRAGLDGSEVRGEILRYAE